MTAVRRPDLAGSWYPGDRAGCLKEIEGYLAGRPKPSSQGLMGTGGVVPHAGWHFSGRVACTVFAALADINKDPDVIAVIGMHLSPNSPNYTMEEGEWQTPLGNIAIAGELAGELTAKFPFRVETAARHSTDNTIELQLPFVKYFFPDAELLPLGLPPRRESLDIAVELASRAEAHGLNLLAVGSTDLTHYGPNYGFTQMGRGEESLRWVKEENDRRLVNLLLDMNPEGVIKEALMNHNACCAGAAASALAAGIKLGASKAEELTYATSYDKMPSDSFVGYVGVVF